MNEAATVDAHAKEVATLRAALALANGHLLHELPDGSFAVSRWGWSRRLADLEELREFVRYIGGRF